MRTSTTFTARPSDLRFEVEVETDGNRVRRDWPGDFPPGSPGSSLPSPAPRSFMETLQRVRPGWVVTWQPVTLRHCLWSPAGVGWTLAFYCENPHEYEWADVPVGGGIPLDNRVFAFLYDSDPDNYGGLVKMKIEIESRFAKMEENAAKRRVDWLDEIWYGNKLNTSIRCSMAGRGGGDRFARQVAGEGSRERQLIPY